MKDIATLGPLHGRAREYEKNAIQIRSFAQVGPFECLNPYDLAAKFRMKVVVIKEVPGVSYDTAKKLLVEKADKWSGASSGIQQEGPIIIILNNTQSLNRSRATLMEEICHVLLGHQRNRLSLHLAGSRDYHQKMEVEAYNVGAAALVPFSGLKYFLDRGLSILEIANHYEVSQSLVEYRIKLMCVNHTW
jgi:Zn-dependent peptidase ImmA (M78 family)